MGSLQYGGGGGGGGKGDMMEGHNIKNILRWGKVWFSSRPHFVPIKFPCNQYLGSLLHMHEDIFVLFACMYTASLKIQAGTTANLWWYIE